MHITTHHWAIKLPVWCDTQSIVSGWVWVVPSACKTELISFSSKLLVSFLTRFRRITFHSRATTAAARLLTICSQRNYFLIQSARDDALNKRLTQSVLQHTHTAQCSMKSLGACKKDAQRSVISAESTRPAVLYLAFCAVFRPGKTLFPTAHIIIGWAGARPAQQQSTSFSSCVCVNASEQ